MLNKKDIFGGDQSIDESNLTLKKISKNDIAIIGIDCKFPKAKNIKEYWENIKSGTDSITRIPLERKKDVESYLKYRNYGYENINFQEGGYLDEIDKFDYKFFGISPKEAELMDPNQRIFLETAWHAIEDAGYGGNALVGSNTGVYVGFGGSNEYKKIISEIEPNSLQTAVTGNLRSIIASRISYFLDLKGPAMLIDTTCSSSLVATHTACKALINGECEMAIVGGVTSYVIPIRQVAIGVESSDYRSKTFDERSDGAGTGEGVGAIILKPLNQAIKDKDNIYAIIKGSAINQDGKSATITAPNPKAQRAVIEKAWNNAGVDPSTISYIETHGTGTKIGDPIEIEGIDSAFRKYTHKKQFCAVSSVKPNIGHLDETAGIASLIKATLSLKNKQLAPMVHFSIPNQKIDFEKSAVYVNDILKDWKIDSKLRRCGVSAFGLTGTNCHIILEEHIASNATNSCSNGSKVFIVSAKSKEQLQNLVKAYYQFLNENMQLNLDDICYTAMIGRGHYEYRLAIIVNSLEDLKEKLSLMYDSEVGVRLIDDVYYGQHRIVPDNTGQYLKKFEITKKEIEELSKNANQFIKNVDDLKQEELLKLSELYIKGADIKWELLFKNSKYKRISLPLYPFNKIRCWLNIPEINNECSKLKEFKDITVQMVKGNNKLLQIKGRDKDFYTDTEKYIAKIWASALGYEEINIFDNYYEMGGNSIIASKIINTINNEKGIKLEYADLFKNPSIELLSKYIQDKALNIAEDNELDYRLKGVLDQEYYLASSAQKRMFKLNNLAYDKTSYNLPSIMSVKGKINVNKIKEIAKKFIERHEVFKTSFHILDDELYQKIHKTASVDFFYKESFKGSIEDEIKAFIKPFDLNKPPLLRIGIIKIDEEESLLLFDKHHIIFDGISMDILVKEFIKMYDGQELDDVKMQYKEYCLYEMDRLKTEVFNNQKLFWKKKFEGELPILKLPIDYSYDKNVRYLGKSISRNLEQDLVNRLYNFTKTTQTTLFMVLFGVYNILLNKYSDNKDIIIGTPVSGRNNSDFENTLGMFGNILAIRTLINNKESFEQFLAKIKGNLINSYDNQDYPFEILLEELKIKSKIGGNPLFNTMISLEKINQTSIKTLETKELTFSQYEYENQTSEVELYFKIEEGVNDIKLEMNYYSQLFNKDTIVNIIDDYIGVTCC